MNDQDISKIVAKLTESLATKDDISSVKDDIHRLEDKISDLDKKSDLILEFAQAVDEEVDDHKNRLTKIEDHLRM